VGSKTNLLNIEKFQTSSNLNLWQHTFQVTAKETMQLRFRFSLHLICAHWLLINNLKDFYHQHYDEHTFNFNPQWIVTVKKYRAHVTPWCLCSNISRSKRKMVFPTQKTPFLRTPSDELVEYPHWELVLQVRLPFLLCGGRKKGLVTLY